MYAFLDLNLNVLARMVAMANTKQKRVSKAQQTSVRKILTQTEKLDKLIQDHVGIDWETKLTE